MDSTDIYNDIDALRSKAYAGMVVVAGLRSITNHNLAGLIDAFGVDLVARHLADLVADYDSGALNL
jgi:hypothetical protein